MITRMTSLAALVAAGMTLSACQEEEAETTTGEETTSEQSEMTDAETATAGSETAEAEAEPTEPESDTAAEVEGTAAQDMTETEAGTASDDASDTDEQASDSGAMESGSSTEDTSEPAAEVESSSTSSASGSDQEIQSLLTTENFQPEEIVAYLENADLDDNTREALTQAVEEVDPSNEVAVSALITRLEIALDLDGEGSADPAASTEQ